MTAPERTNMKILDYLKERTLEALDRQEDALIEELHTGSYERDTEIYEEIDRVRAAMRALSLYDDEMTAESNELFITMILPKFEELLKTA